MTLIQLKPDFTTLMIKQQEALMVFDQNSNIILKRFDSLMQFSKLFFTESYSIIIISDQVFNFQC